MISLALMVKDEQDQILRTLESVKDQIDYYYILDTGSTDRTIELAQQFGRDHGKKVFVASQSFVDYSTNRNYLLDWINSQQIQTPYLLLLDANDQAEGLPYLITYLKENPQTKMLFIAHQWEHGVNSVETFFNLNLIHKDLPLRYKGRVHESLDLTPEWEKVYQPKYISPLKFRIFQKRSLDKSSKGRLPQDLIWLQQDLAENPDDLKIMFHLAQTYKNLKDFKKAMYWYDRVAQMNTIKGHESASSALYLKAVCATQIPETTEWEQNQLWIQAYQFYPRAEPLCFLADYYHRKGNLELAWSLIQMACRLPLEEHRCLDYHLYQVGRWTILNRIKSDLSRVEPSRPKI